MDLKPSELDNSLPKQAGVFRAYTLDVTLRVSDSGDLEANTIMNIMHEYHTKASNNKHLVWINRFK